MLSYQHGYHAGNFADVIKHLTLARILNYMTSKEKPIFYLETHSGKGIYDLKGKQAAKTTEYHRGINLLWEQKKKLPAPFSPYLQTITAINEPNELRYYPGSPCLAIHSLRKQDRLFFYELHPREFSYLQKLPRQGKRVFYEESDGIIHLNAKLPPLERRGLIFIDPSYEVKTDYKQIPLALKKAHLRFSTGVYCLWYPLIDKKLHEQLLRNVKSINANSLRIEFYLNQKSRPGMTGCGLWIINPPYCLADEMKISLQYLRTLFNPGSSTFLIEEYS